MSTEATVRNGDHQLTNLTEEQFAQLPTSIHGICACGYRGPLYVKLSPFGARTAWYICSGCHWQLDCWWRDEERKFEKIREVLFLVGQQAPIPEEMATYARKLLGERE